MHIFVRIVSDLYLRRGKFERNCRSATRSLRDGCTLPLGQWACRSGGYPGPARTTAALTATSTLLCGSTFLIGGGVGKVECPNREEGLFGVWGNIMPSSHGRFSLWILQNIIQVNALCIDDK